jgi:F-type H+-transporting ATPase subunit b
MKRLILLLVITGATLAAAETESVSDNSTLWKWANFAILAVVLGYFMVKFLPPLFVSRTKEIQMGISEAQKMKQDAERRSAEMDARLSALGADIEKFRTQSTAEMQQESERIGKETAAQLKKIEEQAAMEIETIGKTVRRQLKEYAAELAMGLAEERLRAKLDGATESALVDGFVHDLERQASQTGSKN